MDGIHHWATLKVGIENWPECDLNPQALNSVQAMSLTGT